MNVVNDCAEIRIALVTSYNSCITKGNDKKQYLLRPVCLHRRKIPEVSKGTLKKV